MNNYAMGQGLTGFLQGAMDFLRLYTQFQSMQNQKVYQDKLLSLREQEANDLRNYRQEQLNLQAMPLEMKQAKEQQIMDIINKAKTQPANQPQGLFQGSPAAFKEADMESVSPTMGSNEYGLFSKEQKQNLTQRDLLNIAEQIAPLDTSKAQFYLKEAKMLTPKEKEQNWEIKTLTPTVTDDGKVITPYIKYDKKSGKAEYGYVVGQGKDKDFISQKQLNISKNWWKGYDKYINTVKKKYGIMSGENILEKTAKILGSSREEAIDGLDKEIKGQIKFLSSVNPEWTLLITGTKYDFKLGGFVYQGDDGKYYLKRDDGTVLPLIPKK